MAVVEEWDADYGMKIVYRREGNDQPFAPPSLQAMQVNRSVAGASGIILLATLMLANDQYRKTFFHINRCFLNFRSAETRSVSPPYITLGSMQQVKGDRIGLDFGKKYSLIQCLSGYPPTVKKAKLCYTMIDSTV
jgi:hypothetical protein